LTVNKEEDSCEDFEFGSKDDDGADIILDFSAFNHWT
jgi:hypothetical protein